MIHIITLIYLLIYLNNSGVIDATDPGLIREIAVEAQLHGAEATAEKILNNKFAFIPNSGDETLEIIKPNEASEGILPENMPDITNLRGFDLKTLDYKEELKKLGFYREESKDVALNLRNAVLRFQSSCNMTVDGKWNERCLENLALLIIKGGMAVDHVEKPPTEGKWIVINKTKRILTLYENRKILRKYPVSIGNPPSLTPDGKFTVVNKIINPSWGGGGYTRPVKGGVPENPLGYRWIGMSYKEGNTLGIHGNNSPYSIGRNVSHGCIRMINSDVEELFPIVSKSTIVWIGTEDKLRKWGVIQNEYAHEL